MTATAQLSLVQCVDHSITQLDRPLFQHANGADHPGHRGAVCGIRQITNIPTNQDMPHRALRKSCATVMAHNLHPEMLIHAQCPTLPENDKALRFATRDRTIARVINASPLLTAAAFHNSGRTGAAD